MMAKQQVIEGDSCERLREFADDSIDAVVTDPPYGLGFMSKSWDRVDTPFRADFWREVMRVLKPGGHALVFGGSRTFHRMAVALEDAGFEYRDTITWLFGSGFPKNHDISKSIDRRPFQHKQKEFAHALASARKEAGLSRKQVDERVVGASTGACWNWEHHQFPEARFWPALKAALPALDDAWGDILAEAKREVLETRQDSYKRTVTILSDRTKEYAVTKAETNAARQWEGWGTALKPAAEYIALVRKPISETSIAANVLTHGTGAINVDGCRVGNVDTRQKTSGAHSGSGWGTKAGATAGSANGRHPANVIHDGSDEVTSELGGASRFFYSAKASKRDRDCGERGKTQHPTVKPVALMAYLCRLITPPGGTVMDPFAGSGVTGEAAVREGMHPTLIEREPEYQADIHGRMARAWKEQNVNASSRDV